MSEAWKIVQDNDTGPNDESFASWYQVGPVRVDNLDDAIDVSEHPVLRTQIKQRDARIAELEQALSDAVRWLDNIDDVTDDMPNNCLGRGHMRALLNTTS